MAVRNQKKPMYPFPEAFYKNLAQKLYRPLTLGENCVFVCPPLYGKDYMMHYLWERGADRAQVLGTHTSEFLFAPTTIMNASDTEHTQWIKQLVASLPHTTKPPENFAQLGIYIKHILHEENLKLVFYVNISSLLPLESIKKFMELATQTLFLSPGNIQFIIAYDQAWDIAEFHALKAQFNMLFQHTVYPAHRTDDEIRHFIHYRLNTWHHTLTPESIEFIIKESGGIPLLAKAVVRIAKATHATTLKEISDIITNHGEYKERVNMLYSTCTEKQKQIIHAIAKGQENPPSEDLEHLLYLGILIKSTNSTYSIRSYSLLRHLNPTQNTMFEHITRSSRFTQKEVEIVKILCTNYPSVVGRDALSEILWGKTNDNSYSDWALDQSMSRLRRKVETIKEIAIQIQAKKKKGFYIERI